MRFVLALLFSFLFIILQSVVAAQVTPIAVTGFNQDAIAEAGPSSLATTTLEVDGGLSNKVMYTNAFRIFAGIGGGGLPDNGTISSGGNTYQLANYTGNNALYVYRNETRGLSLVTPSAYSRIRVLAFSTEGASTLYVKFVFTDGSYTDYLTNYSLPDWFTGTPNSVLQGFGRCSRVAAAPWGADGFPSNPSMYFIDIPLNCADKNKNLQSVFFSNFSTPNNAPFPNAVILGMSGMTTVLPIITAVITPCDCNGPNGSISLTVTGNASPYTFSWNLLTPVQTGPVATGLPPGNHTCTITDVNGCITRYTASVPLNNNGAITALANPLSVCPGEPVTLSVNVVNGSYQIFGWQLVITPLPPFILGQTITVNPTVTTTYRAAAQRNGFSWWDACNTFAFVTVTVNPVPASPVVNNITICPGAAAVLQVQSPQPGYIYNWYTMATGGSPAGTGVSYTVNNVTANTTVYVEAVNINGCISATRTAASISLLQQLVQPVVTLTSTTFTSLIFSWNAVPGATAYEVTTNGGATFQLPSSGPSGTTHTITGLAGNTTVILQVRVLKNLPCEASLLSVPVTGTTPGSKEIFVPNVFTPNGDGRNDVLLVYGNYVASIQFRIFNQWGQLIFISDNISNGWNGIYKGQQQSVGVYAYTLKVVLQDGSIINKKGSINLIR